MKIEPHQIEAWVDELGKLHVEIPRSTGMSDEQLERFIADHPEAAPKLEAGRERMCEEREAAAWLIGNIYAHYLCGSPSTWGLLVDVDGYRNLLEEEHLERGRRGR